VLYWRKGPRSLTSPKKEGKDGTKEGGKEANERFLLVTCDRPIRNRSMSDIQLGTLL
jgi:hypothetical protein